MDCWGKAKELRAAHYRDVWEAKEKGKLIISGGESSFLALPAGLGDYEYLGGEPYGATVGNMPDLAVEYMGATAAKGYPREMCAYCRIYLGSMFLNRSPFGEFVKPDFCLPWHCCDSHAKWYQVLTDYYSIPLFAIDFPLAYSDERFESRMQYLLSQFYDAIEWMEKTTGREYDDEKLIEAVRNDVKSTVLWARICELNKAIPAPLDIKSMFSLYVIMALERHKKRAVEFYQLLFDEVKDRVQNKIAAVSNEKCRMLHDSVPPWYFLNLFRYAQSYGVAFVMSPYVALGGAFERGEDGSWQAMETLEEQGIELKTREDALRFLAEAYLKKPLFSTFFGGPRGEDLIRMGDQWHSQGVVLHFSRGCEGLSLGQMEAKLALKERGIPCVSYEGNHADPRDFDESRALNNLETFFQSIGLSRLE